MAGGSGRAAEAVVTSGGAQVARVHRAGACKDAVGRIRRAASATCSRSKPNTAGKHVCQADVRLCGRGGAAQRGRPGCEADVVHGEAHLHVYEYQTGSRASSGIRPEHDTNLHGVAAYRLHYARHKTQLVATSCCGRDRGTDGWHSMTCTPPSPIGSAPQEHQGATHHQLRHNSP